MIVNLYNVDIKKIYFGEKRKAASTKYDIIPIFYENGEKFSIMINDVTTSKVVITNNGIPIIYIRLEGKVLDKLKEIRSYIKENQGSNKDFIFIDENLKHKNHSLSSPISTSGDNIEYFNEKNEIVSVSYVSPTDRIFTCSLRVNLILDISDIIFLDDNKLCIRKRVCPLQVMDYYESNTRELSKRYFKSY